MKSIKIIWCRPEYEDMLLNFSDDHGKGTGLWGFYVYAYMSIGVDAGEQPIKLMLHS